MRPSAVRTRGGALSLALSLALSGCAAPPSGWMVGLYGAVVDADGALLSGAEVSVRSERGDLMGVVESSADGSWYLPVLLQPGQEETLFPVGIIATSEGYVRGMTDAELVLREPLPDYAWYAGPGQSFQTVPLRLPPVTLVPQGDDSRGDGALIDAETGAPVPGAGVVLREGYSAPDSREIIAQVRTDAGGHFTLAELPGGVYTAVVEPTEDYDLTRFPVRVVPGGADGQIGLIAPPGGAGSLRAALIWDPVVAALDLHVTGPVAGSAEDSAGFHLYSEAPSLPPTGEPIAELELIEQGLQTAVIHTIWERGEYRFSGFDVTNAQAIDSDALSRSGALMQLWWDGQAWMETASPGIQATLWRALELDPVRREVIRLQEYEVDIAEDQAVDF